MCALPLRRTKDVAKSKPCAQSRKAALPAYLLPKRFLLGKQKNYEHGSPMYSVFLKKAIKNQVSKTSESFILTLGEL
jgi:hypothetical protein